MHQDAQEAHHGHATVGTGAGATTIPLAAPVTSDPIRRTACLDLHWFDDDPMPSRCSLHPDHQGPHRAAVHGGTVGRVTGPAIEWDQTEGAA